MVQELTLNIPTSYGDISLKKWMELQTEMAINGPSFRYFPLPILNDFSSNAPVIVGIDSGNVLFNVPVSVPPYFASSVYPSGVIGDTVSGSTSPVTNPGAVLDASDNAVLDEDGNYIYSYSSGVVSGLSYAPTADSSFQLNVVYVYSEYTGDYFPMPVAQMTVQQQGFPSSSADPPSFVIPGRCLSINNAGTRRVCSRNA